MMFTMRSFLRWPLLAVALLALTVGLLHERPSLTAAASNCVPARPHAAGDFSETVVSGGVTRSYELHVPPSYVENEQTPLVLTWHGLGSTATVQQAFTGLSQKADAAGFIVAAPAFINTLTELQPGQVVWLFITGATPVIWEQPLPG